jgi:hypothetical protein
MRYLLAVLPILVGCRQLLGFETPVGGSDANGPEIDAGPCAMLGTSCSGNTLRICTALGELPVESECALGCVAGDQAHCGVIAPAGGGVAASDLDPAELATLPDADIAGLIDGDNGTIGGQSLGDFRVKNGIAVFRFHALTISGPVQLRGSRPIALVSDQDLIVGAVIDARGTCSGNSAGPGGFVGGLAGTAGAGLAAGTPGTNDGNLSGGGGGGANGGNGGSGGKTQTLDGGTGGTGGADPSIAMLVGGSGGGGGFGQSINTGGGGGGAVQLVSNHTISIKVSGGINAGGCGSQRQNCPDCSSGGGGAGGTILLEAFAITIEGALAVNGGGAAGSGSDGEDGQLSRTAALGGAIGNGGPGGAGAAGAVLDGASAPDATQRPGGGGGGIGRIRANTRDGMVNASASALLSPAFNDAPTTATAGSIAIE